MSGESSPPDPRETAFGASASAHLSARSTANRKFRRSYRVALVGGMAFSLALHGALYVAATSPERQQAVAQDREPELVILPPLEQPEDVLERPPAVEVPPPEAAVRRPGRPVPVVVEEEVEEEEEEELPEEPEFIPHDTPPRLVNTVEIRQRLLEEYPERLRREGIEGRVLLWLFVDESGDVRRLQLQRSSGHAAFDRAAQEVAPHMRFSPALNQSRPIGVWVAQPIRFSIIYEETAADTTPPSESGGG